jgi:hypothetical protein
MYDYLGPGDSDAQQTRVLDLRAWADRPWTDGLEVTTHAAFDHFAVHTRNSVYDIVILQPATGEVLVRGGRFFPAYTRARLMGCSLGGAFLKLRAIYPGFSIELQSGDQVIVTTRVQSIAQLTAATVQ